MMKDGWTDGRRRNDERESERQRGGESCKRLKWNVIRAPQDTTEQKAFGRLIPDDRCGRAIGIEHAALTKPTIASNWRWRKEGRKDGRKETRK